MKIQDKILTYFIETKDNVTINQLAKNIDKNYKNVYEAVLNLSKELHIKKVGNSKLLSFNYLLTPSVFKIEKHRQELLTKENNYINLLKKEIDELNNPFVIVLIFGSIAKKEAGKQSDIDISVISPEKISKTIYKKISLLSINLDFHSYTPEEFNSMLKTKEDNIAKEIVKSNIIISGIENYYKLIEKWMRKDLN